MRRVALAAAASCLVLAGCGGEAASPQKGSRERPTLEALWRAPGDDVAVIAGTQTHVPGTVRVSFLVLDAEGAPVLIPTARVFVSRGLEDEPFLETTAQLERVGVPGLSDADATHIYVARLALPEPGTYWLLAEPEGGKPVQALGTVVVSADDPVPDVGEAAPRSQTPTLASVGGDASRITTRTPPDELLLQWSVADAIRARMPFVVTFATPKFCESRVCGPVVDVVEEVAKRFGDERIAFIHVEVYEGNDPAKGYNRWMREWGLQTEPWTFVVRADGRIAERYEGVVSVKELEARVAALLETGR